MTSELRKQRLLDIAKSAFRDAIAILQLIEVLEGMNAPDVVRNISNRGAGGGALVVRHSLFWQLHMLVARCYGSPRPNDLHLRCAFELLEDDEIFAAMVTRGARTDLAESQALWQNCNNHPRLNAFIHFRNKNLAHLAEPRADIPKPQYDDVFEISRATAQVMEKLANGVGIVALSLESQLMVPRRSISAFLSPWRDSVPV